MLVLSRKTSERVMIGSDVVVTVVRIGPNAVRLGIQAPNGMKIFREELIDDKIVVVHKDDEFDDVPMIQVGVDDITDLGSRPKPETFEEYYERFTGDRAPQ